MRDKLYRIAQRQRAINKAKKVLKIQGIEEKTVPQGSEAKNTTGNKGRRRRNNRKKPGTSDKTSS